MSIKIFLSADVNFNDTGSAGFFAKNVQARDNLEFMIELHFEYDVLPPDSQGTPYWERMRVSQENKQKLRFFADTSNHLFQLIDRIVDIEKNGSIWKLIFSGERSKLYKQYDEFCKNSSGDWITVHGRWGN